MDNSGFEQAIFVNALKGIDQLLAGVSRWYMGHEFCEKLIFSTSALNERLAVAQKMGKAVTLVTPYVTGFGIDSIRRILPLLNGDGKTEVVFNDWGVFHLLKKEFPQLLPVMGRVLSRQKRDPQMLNIFLKKQKTLVEERDGRKVYIIPKKIPVTLKEYHGSCPVNSKPFQRFLIAQGIHRVELDCLLWDMQVDMSQKIAVSFYGPYGYVATGRMCAKVSLTSSRCEKVCQSRYFQWEDSSTGTHYLIVGGTLFYRNDAGFKGQIRSCDRKNIRIVRQLEIPS